MTKRLLELVPSGRCLMVLEGATTSRPSPTRRPPPWRRCSASSTSPEKPSVGGPGQRVLDAVAGHWADLLPA